MEVFRTLFQRTTAIPSRFFRNSLELSGRIVRFQRERKRLFELIYSRPCLTLISEWEIKREFELSQSLHFIINVKRQVKNLIRKRKKINSYFELERPCFSGDVFLTDADDSVENGQFKKLKVEEDKIELRIKLPEGKRWIWKKVKLETPERVRKLLRDGYTPKAPLLKREREPTGDRNITLCLCLRKRQRKKKRHPREFSP